MSFRTAAGGEEPAVRLRPNKTFHPPRTLTSHYSLTTLFTDH